MKFLPRLLLVFLLSGLESPVAEAPVDHLYQARVPLDDRSEATQQQAIREGFQQVLVKVSGYSGTARFAGVVEELDQADSYLLEYAIESGRQPAADGLATQPGEALWMRFNPGLIDEFVRRWEIPVWPSSRPHIGLALSASLGGQDLLLNPENYPAVQAALQQGAYERGVHLEVLPRSRAQPLLQSGTPSAEQSGLDYWGVVDVRQDRFGTAQVSLNGQSVSGDNFFADTSSEILGEAVASALDHFVDQVSAPQSFVASLASGNLVTLRLQGITSFADYRASLEAIRSLEMVDTAQVLQLSLNEVELRVQLASNLNLLLDAIRQQGLLQVAGNGAGTPLPMLSEGGATPEVRLIYQSNAR